MTSDHLDERVRAALAHLEPREVRMFGGLSFMVADRMVAAARRDGDLLLRIDPTRHDELVAHTGARPAVMGADRPMGPGWLAVGPAGVEGDDLRWWLSVALEHHAEQGPRP